MDAVALSPLPRTPYLGPAHVEAVGDVLTVRVEASRLPLPAHLAMFMPYQPAVGDVVLLTTEGDRAYVVGVLCSAAGSRGRARLSLRGRGDVTLRSRGRLRLSGDGGVRVAGPTVRLLAQGALESCAEHTLEQLGQATQRVREGWTVAAGEREERVDTLLLTQARTLVHKVREAFLVNGKAVRVG